MVYQIITKIKYKNNNTYELDHHSYINLINKMSHLQIPFINNIDNIRKQKKLKKNTLQITNDTLTMYSAPRLHGGYAQSIRRE